MFAFPSVCQCMILCVFLCVSMFVSYLYLQICLGVKSVFLCLSVSFCMVAYLSGFPCVCVSAYLLVQLLLHAFTCPSSLSICQPSICLSVCLSLYLSIRDVIRC